MEDIYREMIIEHSKMPHNFGSLESPTISHEEHNPLCGDRVRFDLLIEDGVIRDVRFEGKGCAISQATASMLTDEIKGKSVDDAKLFSKDDLLDMIGIPLAKNPVRLKCALLSLKTLKASLYGIGALRADELD